jgi:hypothetical protein
MKLMLDKNNYFKSKILKQCPPPGGGAPLVLWEGGGVDCVRNIFILNEILVQGKIYIFDRHFA